MKIHVTEHKANDELNRITRRVCVFVDQDYKNGCRIEEKALLDMLTEEQKAGYFASGVDFVLDVTPEVAQSIIDIDAATWVKPKARGQRTAAPGRMA